MVSVLQDKTVRAICVQNVEETEGLAIALSRHSSSAELCNIQLGNFTIWRRNCTNHINLDYNKPTTGVCVVMERVSVKDSGVYSCTLDKTIPPPVRTLSQSHICLTVSALPVVEVSLASSSPVDKETTLTCSAWDFYPGDIQLSWSKDSHLFTNSTRNDSLFHNSNGSYSYRSNLVVSKDDWNEFAQFSCQVNHSTLKMPVVKNLTLTQSGKGKCVLCIMTFLGGTIYSLRSPVSNRKYGCKIKNMTENKWNILIFWLQYLVLKTHTDHHWVFSCGNPD
ncbi:unnamed protein product [Lepidochelys olivacea]